MAFKMSFERKAEERGFREGFQEGFLVGFREGFQEGRRESLREIVIRWFDRRGVAVPSELRAPLGDPSLTARLERCWDAALAGADVEQVRALLSEEPRNVRARRSRARPRT